jgi:hypothetical protein
MNSLTHGGPVAGPVYVRLLARATGAAADDGKAPPLAATLAQWIDWPRAVTLAGALDNRLADGDSCPPRFDPSEDEACARTREQLRAAILSDPLLAMSGGADEADFSAFRARHLAHQRAMLSATGRLRGRLRDMLAAFPVLARLGEVDAAMEQVLAPREHALLAGVPDLLAPRFERLREQAAAAQPATAWLDHFRLELRALLLAELDLRFSPIEALLAALRAADPIP